MAFRPPSGSFEGGTVPNATTFESDVTIEDSILTVINSTGAASIPVLRTGGSAMSIGAGGSIPFVAFESGGAGISFLSEARERIENSTVLANFPVAEIGKAGANTFKNIDFRVNTTGEADAFFVDFSADTAEFNVPLTVLDNFQVDGSTVTLLQSDASADEIQLNKPQLNARLVTPDTTAIVSFLDAESGLSSGTFRPLFGSIATALPQGEANYPINGLLGVSTGAGKGLYLNTGSITSAQYDKIFTLNSDGGATIDTDSQIILGDDSEVGDGTKLLLNQTGDGAILQSPTVVIGEVAGIANETFLQITDDTQTIEIQNVNTLNLESAVEVNIGDYNNTVEGQFIKITQEPDIQIESLQGPILIGDTGFNGGETRLKIDDSNEIIELNGYNIAIGDVEGNSEEGLFRYEDGNQRFSILGASWLVLQGSDVASATSLPISKGNSFEVTGSTTIESISTIDRAPGSRITLHFASTPQLTHNASPVAAESARMILAGSTNFTAGAGDNITFELVSLGATTYWREVARTEF